MKLLSRAEEIILLAILKLKDNAYGVAIRDSLIEDTGLEWSFGSIYTPLDKLRRKGFVTKAFGDPLPERGGRRKCLYRITAKGVEALRCIQQVQNSVWAGIPELEPGGLD
jgi:DNA-binding PadR family transcriptional regulator